MLDQSPDTIKKLHSVLAAFSMKTERDRAVEEMRQRGRRAVGA